MHILLAADTILFGIIIMMSVSGALQLQNVLPHLGGSLSWVFLTAAVVRIHLSPRNVGAVIHPIVIVAQQLVVVSVASHVLCCIL